MTISRTDIAIVGMAGRFPDADSVAELWRLLLDGHEAVHQFDADELRTAGVPDRLLDDPAYIAAGTRLRSAPEHFDAAFFGMTPADAAVTDPQHRLFLECAWRALEDAGMPASGKIGVFASAGEATYLAKNVLPQGNYDGSDLPHSVRLGNQNDFVATRVCYALDLRGPAVTVQTACSSALIGVDAACAALAIGRCDAALAGAVELRLPHPSGYLYTEGGIWSRDGHCRPFDAGASGWVAGNGGAVVVLKRLVDAVADRDRVYAVIRGIGVNNDGADKVSFAAPSTSAQIGVIEQALADAGIPAREVGYVEAHGSGTVLGDPIEVQALAKAYANAGGVAPQCGLGSIKANVGHMGVAAGVAGLIKTALVLHHQVIPPQINLVEPNPLLGLDASGFVIHQEEHRPAAGITAAAVSSLGMGGTNTHIVLTPGPEPEPRRSVPVDQDYELRLSARNHDDLRVVARELADHLTSHQLRIDDVAYTLARGRRVARETVVVRARTTEQAADLLRNFADDAGPTPTAAFTGQPEPVDAVKIALPGYPLRPVRHWIEPPAAMPVPDQHTAVSGDVLDAVVEVFRRRLGVASFGPDDDFEAAGGSSMTALEIVDDITDRIGPALTLGRFIQLRTPRRITEEIRTWPGGTLTDPVVLQLQEGPPGQEIFFIHAANGTVFCYQKFVLNTAFAKPVYGISYPFDDPHPPVSIADMAARYIAEIKKIAPRGPYRLAGYSLGANIALEMTHQLERAGDAVTDIVMVDGVPLDSYPRHFVEADYLRVAPITLAYLLGIGLPAADATTIDEALAMLRQPTWSSRTVATMRRFVERVVGAGLACATAHEPPPVKAPLTLLSATDQHNPVYDAVGIRPLSPESWRQRTTGQVTIIPIPGNHYTIYSTPEGFAQLTAALDEIYGD
jgi:3-oxoacyl-(acyl-carrier-protein) synthase/thioesterase domain-containing protein